MKKLLKVLAGGFFMAIIALFITNIGTTNVKALCNNGPDECNIVEHYDCLYPEDRCVLNCCVAPVCTGTCEPFYCSVGETNLGQLNCYTNEVCCEVPAPAGCTTGSCYYGIAACSTYGLPDGTGSCSGGICCIPPTPTPTIPPTNPPTPSPTPSAPPPPGTPYCEANFGISSIILGPGSSTTISLVVTPHYDTIDRVRFIPSDTNVVTVNPEFDYAAPYQTKITASGTANGSSATITGRGVLTDGTRCEDTLTVNVSSLSWWQIVDSDILTNGSLVSVIPINNYFNLAGAGGFPGVSMYGTNTNLTSDNVSEKGWLAHSTYNASKVYNSSYFINLIPGEVLSNPDAKITLQSIDGSALQSGGAYFGGYYWYIYDGTSTGPLTISSAVDLGNRKVILISENAGINFSGNVILTNGEGFFLAVSGGDINIGTSVDKVKGIFVADGSFNTGNVATQLIVTGSVAAYGGINLQRDLGSIASTTTPAEVFRYAPDLEMLFPKYFSSHVTKWQEVAP